METTPASEILGQLTEKSNVLKSAWCSENLRLKTFKEADYLLDQLLELRPVEIEA